MYTVTVADRTNWLRSSFYRTNLQHDDAQDADDGGDMVPGTPPSDTREYGRKKPDSRPSPKASSSRTEGEEHEDGHTTVSESIASSVATLERRSTRGLAAVDGAAADPHPSFHAVHAQIVRLQEQQQQQQRFFAEQLQLLHDHQQQQQTHMEQLMQLYQQQQQQQRRHQMFDSCICQ